MAALRSLNSKERKKVLAQLEVQYGCETDFLKAYVFLLQETKRKYFIVNEALFGFDLAELRVDSLGLYLCCELKNGELRLSIEGSQLLGPHATKGILNLDDDEFARWIRGANLEKETELRGFLIVRHGSDFVGAGKPVEKSGKVIIHNYIPKTRYVRSDE